METAESGRRAATLFGAAALCAAIYFVDILCVRLSDTSAAAFTVNVALPLDLMAVAPLAFWLAYVRTHKKSPILVLPVIYLGGLASAAMSIDGQFTLVPYLLVAAAAVDFAVLGLELPRIIRIIKTLNDEAKNDGCPPPQSASDFVPKAFLETQLPQGWSRWSLPCGGIFFALGANRHIVRKDVPHSAITESQTPQP